MVAFTEKLEIRLEYALRVRNSHRYRLTAISRPSPMAKAVCVELLMTRAVDWSLAPETPSDFEAEIKTSIVICVGCH